MLGSFSRSPCPEGKKWGAVCVRWSAEGISAGWRLSVEASLDSWGPLGDTRPQAQPWPVPQTHGGWVSSGYVTAEGTSFWAKGSKKEHSCLSL